MGKSHPKRKRILVKFRSAQHHTEHGTRHIIQGSTHAYMWKQSGQQLKTTHLKAIVLDHDAEHRNRRHHSHHGEHVCTG